jgi:recombinational DNA repair protein RecR
MENLVINHWQTYTWGEVIEGIYKGQYFKLRSNLTDTYNIETKYENVKELLKQAYTYGCATINNIKDLKVIQ